MRACDFRYFVAINFTEILIWSIIIMTVYVEHVFITATYETNHVTIATKKERTEKNNAREHEIIHLRTLFTFYV